MPRFFCPTRVIMGCGTLADLGEIAARYGSRAMLVCGTHFAQRTGLVDRATALLRDRGLHVTLYAHVGGEADLQVVESGIDLARAGGCDLVIGLGGGSAVDTAKAIAGMATLPGTVWEYHEGRALDGAGLPFIAVPTTSGTGAEVTKNSVLINPRNGVKKSIRDDTWFARVALIDPETTVSMPPHVTASTGSDALCQAIEAYTSIAANPLTDSLAIRSIELVGRSLSRAYHDGGDIEAREDMSMAAVLAGMAMASARLGGVHGMAHPLGARYNIPHGVVCGLLLPYTMAHNVAFADGKYAHVASLMGEDVSGLSTREAAGRAVNAVRRLVNEIGVPSHLAQYGVAQDAFDLIIEESLPSGSLKHNPRPLGAEDVRAILQAAL